MTPRLNPKGTGIENEFELQRGDSVVYDAKTGLSWQQSGSKQFLIFEAALAYVRNLNKEGYGGFHDWRLPTVEEAMSLMESKQKNGDLYIDPIFDQKQQSIWTADKVTASYAWVVDFTDGGCYGGHVYLNFSLYVRAVR